MEVIKSTGTEDIATVYLAQMDNGKAVEFVESVQPPIPREKKWVIIVSTLFGCPVGCKMCDAGGDYSGKLTKGQITDQIDFLIRRRYPGGNVPAEKFKIQFSRMGEPALNSAVLDVLEELPKMYNAPGLIPSLSTIAPAGSGDFFGRLSEIKKRLYSKGKYQLQFSIHSTDIKQRDEVIPAAKWSFGEIAKYGEKFFEEGDRKLTLNFALAKDMAIDPFVLGKYFSPEKFLIKITPLNPTYKAAQNRLESFIDPQQPGPGNDNLIRKLRNAGYEVILSIGETRENRIGSNCGQYVQKYLSSSEKLEKAYGVRFQKTSFETTAGNVRKRPAENNA
ncbi:MAG: radical SAM protein [Candidatus Krumholzibacteriota bacterium]|nr:radical SAM protein [Candidatus Krumholzibacteriota bacterium]